ncbi:some similarities with Saccharomyces cerevisiae YPL048W CAM1 Nuclear protein required for transcription of MXR1 [Maudiozyma barnettii]|uniref:Some similarities with Saccharomyces cerevisiae YPL048W CAM1 Nuclear protein required for transcription of MXR1 n=1 Tax=Maudiozyma barnettii TaxID=61262 RepID=A0A8H2ZHG9_9SACH|nr:uncharacterized protein KABA2_05S00154 [Kazachstania barnettii]CAB4254753.1 some similarities with Saccharomyces cerevisiae YPL048W CAM1 Nuclear protein required for transcription of MXR1 [Kazachstania barnettii]CAD1782869.1 some similarities with Saccharomyces cerevisiae YPL048W CAM1 Nuclear protein required for transcription of MXR1 [Kazachstania barnettii]
MCERIVLYVNPEKYCRTILPAVLAKRYRLNNIKLVTVNLEDDEFKTLFPYQKVPALMNESGKRLTEAMAINYYLVTLSNDEKERGTLLGFPEDPWTQAEIIRWQSFANGDFLNELNNYAKPLVGLQTFDLKAVTEAKRRVDTMVPIFEDHLCTHKYLVNENITLADLTAATTFSFGFTFVLDKEWRKEHPAIVNWFNDVINCDILHDFYHDFVFIENRPPIAN